MNTETPTTAAELLAEWKTLNALNENTTTRSLFMAPHLVSHMAEIAARLDEMCEGMTIEDGVNFFGVELDGIDVSPRADRIANMIALLQWIEIKEQSKENHGK